MTAYVTDLPGPDGLFHLWADSPAEALTLALLAGCELEHARPDRSPVHFELGEEQWAAALTLGACVRDKFDAFGDAMIALGRLDMLEGVNDWLASEGHAPRFNRRGRMG